MPQKLKCLRENRKTQRIPLIAKAREGPSTYSGAKTLIVGLYGPTEVVPRTTKQEFFRSLFRAYSSSSLTAGDNRAEDFLCLAIASSTPLRKLSDSGAE
jgi:hypothetical protein